MNRKALELVLREVARRNKVSDGLVYLQVTRGVAPRDHFFPAPDTKPAIVVTAKRLNPAISNSRAETGVKVITVPENRWERVDIKTVGLLPNVLAKQKAREAGAAEAWFIDSDGSVKEGASTNAWIVTTDGKLITRPAEFGILRGITRTTLMDLAAKMGLEVEERAFSVEEAQSAREAFITAASTVVMPVVEIDGRPVANGHPGSLTLSLRQSFFDVAEKSPAC
jgi:D-alanine transaminase